MDFLSSIAFLSSLVNIKKRHCTDNDDLFQNLKYSSIFDSSKYVYYELVEWHHN